MLGERQFLKQTPNIKLAYRYSKNLLSNKFSSYILGNANMEKNATIDQRNPFRLAPI